MSSVEIGLAMALAPLAFAQAQPDLAQILSRVGTLYGNAKQFRFALVTTGEEPGAEEISVQLPNRFRYVTDKEVPSGDDRWGRVTMVSDGDVAWNHVSGLQQYTRKRTSLPLTDIDPPAVLPETFVLQAQTVFLTRYAEFAKAVDRAKLLREEPLQAGARRVDCYVIQFTAPRPGFPDQYTWWVDKARFLIVREDTRPVSPRYPASTALFTEASIDEPLPDGVFRFTPPADARLVDSFGGP